MDEIDYSLLDAIKVSEYDLILPVYSVVSKFCKKNNILTLGQLVRAFDTLNDLVSNNKSLEELYGFIDLVKYRHLGIKLPYESILLDSIILESEDTDNLIRKNWLEAKFISNVSGYPLKRLGLSTDEQNRIKYYIERNNKPMLIINAFISYINDPNKRIINKHKGAQEIFEKKLEILINYFRTNRITGFEEKSRVIKLHRLLNEYKDLEKRLKTIRNKIIEEKENINKDEYNKLIIKYIFSD